MSDDIFKYKVFGRKRGRKINQLKEYDLLINQFKLNEKNLSKKKDNILDIGSGDGESTIYLSNLYPQANIIACDTYVNGNLNLAKNILLNNISNILIYPENVLKLFDKISDNSLFNSVWIFFPDPWPKKRHFKRRLINKIFFQRLVYFLKKNAQIHIVTDSQSYLRQMLLTIYESKGILIWQNQSVVSWEFNIDQFPKTKYYRKALKTYRKPIYINLKKL